LICNLVSCFQIPLASAKLLALFSISPLLYQTSTILWTKYFSLCMLLPRAIGPLLNVYCDTWKVSPPSVSTLLVTLLYLFMVLLMLIRLSIDDRKFTVEYIVFLGNTPISWKFGKQCTIARSSTETECKALADGTAKVLWLHYLLSNLYFSPSSVTTIWCDNLGATYMSANPIFLTRIKYVEVDYQFTGLKRRFIFASSPPKIN